MFRSPSRRRALAAIPLIAIVAACATGQRPTLTDAANIDDDATAHVLERLDRSPLGNFTATYEITPTSGTDSTEATVTQDGAELRVEVGDVVFTANGTTTTTCDTSGNSCDDYANDARISDLGITHRFWGSAFHQRVATDSGRRVGATTGTVDTIAGQPAACVAIQVPSTLDAVGTVNYCALDQGILARYLGADATIELTSFALT